MSPKRIAALVIGGIALIVVAASIGGLVESVGAGEIVVKQSLWSGNLEVWKTPGPKWQGFGTVTHYKLSDAYEFENNVKKDGGVDNSLKMRFNDGGHGNLSGSIRFDLPLDDEHIIAIHRKFGSQSAVVKTLIARDLEKSVYFSGPLMSSTQSYAERRNELIGFIDDQATHGIYKSSSHCEKAPDPVTKQEKTICLVELDRDGKGLIQRVEVSPLEEYGIKLSNLSISDLDYDDDIKGQIKAQQQAIANVQTAIAEARKAEQRAITAEKEGQANTAKAKWEQEVVKAQAVTKAEQEKEVARLGAEQKKQVAELDKQAAEFKKAENILLGEGEAARKRAVMNADGALQQKLQAWVEVQKAYAEAMKSQKLVPDVQFGNTSGPAGNGAQNFMDVMMVKAARDLSLDFRANGSSNKQ